MKKRFLLLAFLLLISTFPSEILSKYAYETARDTFITFDLEGDSVTVGDKSGTFYSPSLNLSRWGDSWLKLDYPMSPDYAYFEGGKAIFGDNQVVTYFYPLNSSFFEFEIDFLRVNPPSSVLVFPFETENLKAFYQPPLNEESFPKGYTVNATHALNEKGETVNYRPLNVVSSFAFYHTSKRDNKYTTGKAFHLYRPVCVDSIGQTWFADFDPDLSQNVLKIILPTGFLASPNFPKKIDPTFGKTDVGGTWSVGANYQTGTNFQSGSDAQNANVTSLHCYMTNVQNDTKLGTYNLAGNTQTSEPTSLLYGSDAFTPSSDGWYMHNISNAEQPVINATTWYWIGKRLETAVTRTYYDAGVADSEKYISRTFSFSWLDPWGTGLSRNLQWSIYATYTLVEAEEEELTVAEEWFSELMLGEYGGWLGLFMIMIFVFALRKFSKWSNLFSTIVLFLLGLFYYNNIPTDQDLFWAFPLAWIFALFFLLDWGLAIRNGELY